MTGLIARLLAAPDGVNPAVEMSERVTQLHLAGELDQAKIAELAPQINQAADLGDRDLDAATAALRSLSRAGAAPAKEPPLGF
ncbi:MAG TPA: hypothetical protein VJ810_13055 [Blastocatellia bacterium]|nr:hypothetical protein [Blastocatellia bacterium]